MIKLLNKNEISQAKSKDTAREISEGLKLSEKVDALRQLQAKEEEAIEKYRIQTLAIVNKDINDAMTELVSLKNQISSLRAELAKESTLTRQERQNLESLKTELEIRENTLQQKQEKVSLYEIEIAEVMNASKNSLAKQEDNESRSQQLKIDIENEKKEASQNLIRSRKIEDNALRFEKEKQEELSLRENIIIGREKTILSQSKELDKQQKALQVKERQVKDMRETLERSLERLRNNRI